MAMVNIWADENVKFSLHNHFLAALAGLVFCSVRQVLFKNILAD